MIAATTKITSTAYGVPAASWRALTTRDNDRKNTNRGSSNAIPKARNRRVVREKTSRIVQAETTNSLLKLLKN